MEEKITYVRIPKVAVKCDKRSSQKSPPAPRTKALRRGKAPLSHESQPFRHSFLSALAECLGEEGGPKWGPWAPRRGGGENL